MKGRGSAAYGSGLLGFLWGSVLWSLGFPLLSGPHGKFSKIDSGPYRVLLKGGPPSFWYPKGTHV